MSIPAIVRGNGPREGFPDYIVRMLRRDKVGVFTGLVQRHFKVGPTNQRINPEWLIDAPAPWTIPCVDAQAEIADGMCIVAYRYEGAESAPDIDTACTYELDTTMAEKPIETHPDFPKLKLAYGWNDQEKEFSEFIEASDGNGYVPGDGIQTPFGPYQSALAGGPTSQRRNPLAGTTSYFSVAAVFRKSFSVPVGQIPPNVLRGIGTIISSPPGIGDFRLPGASAKRNWLKMSPKLRNRGNLVEIALEWALSHPGGWSRVLYSAGALKEEATDV